MLNQVISSIVLILGCFLIYQIVIGSGDKSHFDDRDAWQ